jgi:Hint domain
MPKQSHPGAYSISRRSLVAAVAVLASAVTTTRAKAQVGPRVPVPSNRCFLGGTRIQTPAGQRAVEDLRIGDLIVTSSRRGKADQVDWPQTGDGHCRDHSRQDLSLRSRCQHPKQRFVPVALACSLPDGVLVPVNDLINGRTISLCMSRVGEVIEYFHVELHSHDAILAEGAAAETMLMAAGSAGAFDNWAERGALYSEELPANPTPFAPILSFNGGRAELRSRLRSAVSPWIDRRRPIDIVRDRLEERAGMKFAA